MTRQRFVPAVLLGLLGCFVCISAHAQAYRLDDTRTDVNPPVVNMVWGAPDGTRAMSLEAQARVLVHVDMSPWHDRNGRIYLSLRNDGAPDVLVRWTSVAKQFTSGALTLGARTLVWSGRVKTRQLNDVWDVAVKAAPDWPTSRRPMDFTFEFEPD